MQRAKMLVHILKQQYHRKSGTKSYTRLQLKIAMLSERTSIKLGHSKYMIYRSMKYKSGCLDIYGNMHKKMSSYGTI